MKTTLRLAILSLVSTLTANLAFAQLPTTAEAHYGLGRQQMSQKDLVGAIKSFSECLKLNASAQPCLYARGVAFFENKQYEPSAVDFSRLLNIAALKPQDTVQALNGRLQALCYAGKVTEATADEASIRSLGGTIKKTCRQFLLENPDLVNSNSSPNISNSTSGDELKKQGISYRKNCEFEKSVDVLTKAIERDPSNGDLYFERASSNIYLRVIAAARDHQKAEELWKLEQAPNFNASDEKEKFKQQFEYNAKTGARRVDSSELRQRLSILIKANKTSQEPDCKPQAAAGPSTAPEWFKLGIKQAGFEEKRYEDAISSFSEVVGRR